MESLEELMPTFKGIISGVTPSIPWSNRAEEIQSHMDSCDYHINNVIIFDDYDDGLSASFGQRYIKVDRKYGLLASDVSYFYRLIGKGQKGRLTC